MRNLMLTLSALALCAGCAPYRTINPGHPIEIRLAKLRVIQAEYPQSYKPGALVDWADPDRPIVWLPSDRGQDELVRATLHEALKHLCDRMSPREALLGIGGQDLMQCGESSDEARARRRAETQAKHGK